MLSLFVCLFGFFTCSVSYLLYTHLLYMLGFDINKPLEILCMMLASIISACILKILHAKFPSLFDRAANRNKRRKKHGLSKRA